MSTRTIIVTGGTSGIGRAIADGFAARSDTRVIAAGLDAVTEDGGGIEQHSLDVRDRRSSQNQGLRRCWM